MLILANKFYLFTAALLILSACEDKNQNQTLIFTSDISNFWQAYDKITSTQDSVLQHQYLDSLYFKKGTLGLKGIRQARNYTAQDYLDAINSYPKFWNSVKDNTLKVDTYRQALGEGIDQLRKLYPELRPRKIYFTIGAMRTGGTYLDSLVLIGSEMALADRSTIASEFPEEIREGRQSYFNQNPIDDIVFLVTQEFVHTQQKPFVHNLLSYCLHEGVGDFVSYTALNLKPNLPAIQFGKQNEAVRKRFEQEMFYINNRPKWLWSDAPNEFGVRDLGYYIGYQMCENYYNLAEDKNEAIKTMIELEYENEAEIEAFVARTNFFSAPLDTLYNRFERKRPFVKEIKQFENKSENVDPNLNHITIEFSKPLNGLNTGVDYGPLGERVFPKISFENHIWLEENKKWRIDVDLEPNKQYQFLISNNFRTEKGIPLRPYLIEFKTGSEK